MGYVLTDRAKDIFCSEQELCYILGYLATPNRIKYIEAQVPYGKEEIFESAYPGQYYEHMRETSDKQSFQFRIILNYNGNCPEVILNVLSDGAGGYNNCISRGKFIERIVNEYGFEFFQSVNVYVVRDIVMRKHPEWVKEFEYGYGLPLEGSC